MCDARGKKAKVVHQDESLQMVGQKKHEVQFAYCCPAHLDMEETGNRGDMLDRSTWLRPLFKDLSNYFSEVNIQNLGEHLQVESFQVSVCSKENCPYKVTDDPKRESGAILFCCSWSIADEKIPWEIMSRIQKFSPVSD